MSKMETIDTEELHHYRNIILAFILNNSTNKIPIKASKIIEVLDKKTKIYNYCLPLVVDALKETYGIQLINVSDSKTGTKFICCSEIIAKSIHEYDKQQQRHITLLFIILSYIFMTGCPVYENQLEDFLRGLKIYFDSEHAYFGADLKKVITDTFVKQLYLKKVKSDSEFDNEIKYLYSWGHRSIIEFQKKDVLEATAKILDKPVKFFVAQYNEVYENDDNVE